MFVNFRGGVNICSSIIEGGVNTCSTIIEAVNTCLSIIGGLIIIIIIFIL